MAAACETSDAYEETMYTFRFGTSNKIVQLTQEQLDHFPYLATLVAHRNDFSSIENENGEYVLSSRIRYNWFMPIFQSIKTGHPSALFTELAQEAYVWCMLQLYDYLCLNPIPVPLLKYQHLVRLHSSDIDTKNCRVEYRRAKNLLEVRDTAVQFIIVLSKNEYNLNDSKTLYSIFSLIMIILSHPNEFGLRLCHHTLVMTKKLYFSLFSHSQQHRLHQAEQIIHNIKAHSLLYVRDDEEQLPDSFENAFAWKGFVVSIKENDNDDRQSNHTKTLSNYRSSPQLSLLNYITEYLRLYEREFIWPISPSWYPSEDWRIRPWTLRDRTKNLIHCRRERQLWPELRSSIRQSNLYGVLPVAREQASSIFEIQIYQIKQELKKMEAKSARSGRFNTLPKRPKVDKFKHRCGPKAQKYR